MRRTYWRFVISTTMLAALAVMILSTTTLFVVGNYLHNEKQQFLKSNAEVVADMSRRYMENPLPVVFKLYQENLINIAKTNGTSMLFCDMEGNILFVVDSQSYQEPQGKIDAKYDLTAAQSARFWDDAFYEYYQKNVLTYGSLIRGSSDMPFAKLYISSSAGVLDRINRHLFLSLLLSASGLILLCVIIVLTYGRRFTRPMQSIEQAAKAFAEGDFSVRVDAAAVARQGSDLQRLAHTFNDMAQSLQVQEKARRDFIMNITHELRSPMTTIGGFVEGIQDGTIAPERQGHYLQIVHDEIERLSRLVSGTLYLFRMQDNDLALCPEKLNLCELVNKVLFGFEQKILEKELKMEVEYARDTLYILADPDAFTRVIYNLLDNAVKYTDPGGRISIRCFSAAEYAFCIIENTGKGIAKEEIPFVFERYYKADTSRGLAKESFGLGLAIVKSIIEKHKARITLESEPNAFTRFTVQIKLLTRE